MSGRSCGSALVLVYEHGRLVSAMSHEHDGGEAYMGPLIRRAVQYAKVQYEAGDIARILLAEEEMHRVKWDSPETYLKLRNPRHLYRIFVGYDEQSAKRTYRTESRHLGQTERLCAADLAQFRNTCDA